MRERSPVQSHVALHHIHQHSALSSRAPPNSARMCQTPASQPKRTSQEGKCLRIHRSPIQSFLFLFWTSFPAPEKCCPGLSRKLISAESDSWLHKNKHWHSWLTGGTKTVINSLFSIQLQHEQLHMDAVFLTNNGVNSRQQGPVQSSPTENKCEQKQCLTPCDSINRINVTFLLFLQVI